MKIRRASWVVVLCAFALPLLAALPPDEQAAVDGAKAFEKEKKYAQAAASYGKAAAQVGQAARRRFDYLNSQASMYEKAGNDKAASRIFLEAAAEFPGKDCPVLQIRRYVERTIRAKKPELALETIGKALDLPRLTGNDRFELARLRGSALQKTPGRKGEARTHYEGLLEEAIAAKKGDWIVKALYDLRSTYSGREDFAGFDRVLAIAREHKDLIGEKGYVEFLNRTGYSAWASLYEKAMRQCHEELLGIDGKGVTFYGARVKNTLEALDEVKVFPRDESLIVFPDTLSDFGVPMTNKTVHVAKDFGFDPVNATEALQKALDSGASRVIIENTGKPWYIRSVYVRSNTEVILQKGVRIHTDRTWEHFSRGGMFYLKKVKNVVLKGEDPDAPAVISQFHDLMDRAKNCHDYGRSGITIDDSENICVKNLRVADTAEDGLLLGGLGLPNYNCYFENLDLDSNFRQACSIVSARNAYFKNVKFRNTAGAEPLAGIDLEPAELNQGNANLYLYDCVFEGNMGGGLLFSTSSCLPISLHAKRCVFKPQRRGDLMVFIRIGPYAGRNITVPGKAVFEQCDFQGYSDLSPISIDGISLLDLEFIDCEVNDTGKKLMHDRAADASAILFNLNRDVYYEGVPDDSKRATITFRGFRINGYSNAPAIQVRDGAGHYSVRNLKGKIVHNGKKINAARFTYDAPEAKLADVARPAPTNFPAPAVRPADKTVDHPFVFRYNGSWWSHQPSYDYLFFGEKGKTASFKLRWAGWVPGDKTIRLQAPSGKEMKLGQFRVGDNDVFVRFPETGWYLFHPAVNHVLVSHKGVDLCYYAGLGGDRRIQLEAQGGYVGYFEVPARKKVVFKVQEGALVLRNAAGEIVETVKAGDRTGSAYATIKSASGQAEVWSFSLEGSATFKFFAPCNGVWADSPAALPTVAADVVRSPVVKLERKETVSKAADLGPAAKLDDFLARYPYVREILDRQVKERVAWAKEGEFAKRLKNEEDRIAALKARKEINEQAQKEIMDVEKNLPPQRKMAEQEARVLKMSKAELDRYAFCNAFIVLYGVTPYDQTVARDFMRSLHKGAFMAKEYPDVYWWIYKKPYEDFIRGWAGEFSLDFANFTLLCDEDRKLDKLISVLEKLVVDSIPQEGLETKAQK